MLVPVDWLKEMIEISESDDVLSGMLTMAGLEVEGTEVRDGVRVFELNVTPNRPDCMSISGIARETRAITGREMRLPGHTVRDDFTPDFRVIIDSDLCSRYAGRIIRGVKVGESPEWMRRRLEHSGIRSVNNIVDITNYVLVEFGHPLHAFDLDTLKGNTIRVDTANGSHKMMTLDGVERDLSGDTLLIWDAERPVAVAGIMGGLETEVTVETVNVFLESAYFDPGSIRRASKRLVLKTEASYRFERGTDIVGLSDALDRAALLIKELCGGEVSGRIDVVRKEWIPKEIRLRYGRVGRLLGVGVQEDEIKRILMLLGFEIASGGGGEITVRMPSFRVDVDNEADLIEEVGRLYGYGRVPADLPLAPLGMKGNGSAGYIKWIKNIMIASGFQEAINYSFMNPVILDTLSIKEGDERRACLCLMNPLSTEDSSLRTFLLPSLLRNLMHNLNQGVRVVRLFEVSRTFIDRGERLPEEGTSLGAIYLCAKGQRLWEEDVEVYYLMKGLVEKLLLGLHIDEYRFTRIAEPFLHPGKSADISISGKKAGYTGVISPDIRKRLGLDHIRAEIGIIELDITEVIRHIIPEIRYKALPRFPSVQRDIALVIDKEIPAEDVLGLVKIFPSGLIDESWIFDLYEGEGIPEGKRSVGISIIYRSSVRTLTDKDVDAGHGELLDFLMEKTGGTLR